MDEHARQPGVPDNAADPGGPPERAGGRMNRLLRPSGAQAADCGLLRHGVLKYAGNIIARMVPLILLGIFMMPPASLVFARPEQVGLRVYDPGISGPPPPGRGAAGRPREPAVPGAAPRARRQVIYREAGRLRPCPGPR
jgi:hypothetical protein